MNATDELRRLLDERGVEWHGGDAVTYWADADALESIFRDNALDISLYGIAPAQAVEATLGQGGMEWDGDVLVLTLPRDPSSIHVRRADGEPRLIYLSEATLGPRKQPPYDELIEALRRDWDIEASWDGLRRFWYVGLTDEGVRKRDEREATLGRGTCAECKHAHITTRGDANKWCSVIATHDPDGDGDPPNGYDPEPYFNTDFYCGFFRRREVEP